MRHLTYVILAFTLAAITVIFTVNAAVTSAFARFGQPDMRLFGTLHTSSLLSLAAGALTFVVLIRHRRALALADDVVDELKKVTWPTREETVRASVTVVLVTAFTASLLAAYDYVWKNVADVFLFQQGVDYQAVLSYAGWGALVAIAAALIGAAAWRVRSARA